MDEKMIIATMCQEMKWTYSEYLKQPEWLLRVLLEKIRIDNERNKKEWQKNLH
jgi:hypothetical protein